MGCMCINRIFPVEQGVVEKENPYWEKYAKKHFWLGTFFWSGTCGWVNKRWIQHQCDQSLRCGQPYHQKFCCSIHANAHQLHPVLSPLSFSWKLVLIWISCHMLKLQVTFSWDLYKEAVVHHPCGLLLVQLKFEHTNRMVMVLLSAAYGLAHCWGSTICGCTNLLHMYSDPMISDADFVKQVQCTISYWATLL